MSDSNEREQVEANETTNETTNETATNETTTNETTTNENLDQDKPSSDDWKEGEGSDGEKEGPQMGKEKTKNAAARSARKVTEDKKQKGKGESEVAMYSRLRDLGAMPRSEIERRLEHLSERLEYIEPTIDRIKGFHDCAPPESSREELLIYAGLQLIRVQKSFDDLLARFKGLIPKAQLQMDRVVTSIAIVSTACWFFLFIILSLPETRDMVNERLMSEEERHAYAMARDALFEQRINAAIEHGYLDEIEIPTWMHDRFLEEEKRQRDLKLLRKEVERAGGRGDGEAPH